MTPYTNLVSYSLHMASHNFTVPAVSTWQSAAAQYHIAPGTSMLCFTAALDNVMLDLRKNFPVRFGALVVLHNAVLHM